MSELIRLANLCEKATEPSLELDALIAHEILGSTGHDVDYYTASIDAALALAPKGLRVLSMFGPDISLVTLHTEPFGAIGVWHQTVKAATPALALCAAALRARASSPSPAVLGGPKE